MAKLTSDNVSLIRQIYAVFNFRRAPAGLATALGKLFKVKRQTVAEAARGITHR